MVLPKTRKLGPLRRPSSSIDDQKPSSQNAPAAAAQSPAAPAPPSAPPSSAAGAYQVEILDKPPATNKNWWDLCNHLGIDMSQSHRICTDVSRGGVAVLGTWIDDGDVGGKGSGSNGGSNGGSKEGGSKKYRKREDVEERLRALGINYRIVPASGDDGEKAVLSGAEEEDEEKEESVEGDKKRRRRVAAAGEVASSAEGSGTGGGRVDQVASDPAAATNTASSGNPPPNTSNNNNSTNTTSTVNPEIQRLYDANIISQQEYDQMIQADRQFKDETYSVDFTSSSTGGDGSNGGDDNGNNNGGRIPDLYDAYANRLTPSSWVTPQIYTQNYSTLHEMSLLEFCRKFLVPQRGRHAGKIKYHRGGYVTKTLKFQPDYPSDRDGEFYGSYCRYSLVRFRPWVDAPFGRRVVLMNNDDDDDGDGSDDENDENDKKDDGADVTGDAEEMGEEYKPTEAECIQEWEDYIVTLRDRVQYVPDLLLPPELKGGGASLDLFLATDHKDEEEDEEDDSEGGGSDVDDEGQQQKDVGGEQTDDSSSPPPLPPPPASGDNADSLFEQVRERVLAEQHKQETAATSIQARTRCFLEQRRYRSMQSSCIVVQSQVRGMSSRLRYTTVVASVVALQALARGAGTRREYREIRERRRAATEREQKRRQEDAATVIQATWRGHAAREEFRRYSSSSGTMVAGVIALQAMARGAGARREYQETKERSRARSGQEQEQEQEDDAAAILQEIKERKRSAQEQQHDAATIVQATWRGHAAEEEFNRKRTACVAIQSAARGYSSREEEEAYRRDVALQPQPVEADEDQVDPIAAKATDDPEQDDLTVDYGGSFAEDAALPRDAASPVDVGGNEDVTYGEAALKSDSGDLVIDNVGEDKVVGKQHTPKKKVRNAERYQSIEEQKPSKAMTGAGKTVRPLKTRKRSNMSSRRTQSAKIASVFSKTSRSRRSRTKGLPEDEMSSALLSGHDPDAATTWDGSEEEATTMMDMSTIADTSESQFSTQDQPSSDDEEDKEDVDVPILAGCDRDARKGYMFEMLEVEPAEVAPNTGEISKEELAPEEMSERIDSPIRPRALFVEEKAAEQDVSASDNQGWASSWQDFQDTPSPFAAQDHPPSDEGALHQGSFLVQAAAASTLAKPDRSSPARVKDFPTTPPGNTRMPQDKEPESRLHQQSTRSSATALVDSTLVSSDTRPPYRVRNFPPSPPRNTEMPQDKEPGRRLQKRSTGSLSVAAIIADLEGRSRPQRADESPIHTTQSFENSSTLINDDHSDAAVDLPSEQEHINDPEVHHSPQSFDNSSTITDEDRGGAEVYHFAEFKDFNDAESLARPQSFEKSATLTNEDHRDAKANHSEEWKDLNDPGGLSRPQRLVKSAALTHANRSDAEAQMSDDEASFEEDQLETESSILEEFNLLADKSAGTAVALADESGQQVAPSSEADSSKTNDEMAMPNRSPTSVTIGRYPRRNYPVNNFAEF